MNDEFTYTSLRIKRSQLEKLEQLAQQLGISRNRAAGLLIDGAVIVTVKRQALSSRIKVNREEAEARHA